jgi:hypothetical protein
MTLLASSWVSSFVVIRMLVGAFAVVGFFRIPGVAGYVAAIVYILVPAFVLTIFVDWEPAAVLIQ